MFHYIKIQAGIPKTFGDTNSAEQGIIASLSFTGGEHEIAVDPNNGYIPKFAQAKSGVWSDNENLDGRILHGQNDQNVVEDMIGYVTANTVGDLGLVMGDIFRIQALIRDFWQTENQIEPVYLNVWFLDAPGPQFALLYMMDVVEEIDRDDILSRKLTFTIEREPFWRPLPPGSNPKLWSFERLGQIAGRDYDLSDLELVGGTRHLFSQTGLRNVCEHTPAGTATTILTQNWVDIDKSLIAGDAPALACIGLKADVDAVTRFYLGVSHLPETIKDESGGTINQFASLNAGDAAGITQTTDNTCGLVSARGAGGNLIGTITLAASASDIAEWDGADIPLTLQLLRGHWMCFIRGGYDSTTQDLVSAQLDIKVPSTLSSGGVEETHTVGIVNLPGASGWPLATCLFGMTYLGEFRLPLGAGANVTKEGTGIYVGERQTEADIEFQVIFTNNDVSTRIISFIDIMFIPISDSTSFTIGLFDTSHSAIVDQTGYLSHGKNNSIGQTSVDDVSLDDIIFQNELRGNGVKLIPGQDNRIYLMSNRIITIGSTDIDIFSSQIEHEVYVNIIPRWRGVRDV